MSSILPLRSEVDADGTGPRVVDLEGEDAEAVFNALASDTARTIYQTVYREAATASEIAERVGTSVQNVRYHVEKLQKAGLIDQVDTWYSSRGNEMSVYAATNGALIVSGDRSKSSQLRSVIEGFLGGLVALAMVSALAHWLVVEHFTEPVTVTTYPASDEPASGPVRQEYLAHGDSSPIHTVVAEIIVLPPGVLVFLGGLAVLLFATAVWAHRNGRYYTRPT